MSAFLDEYTDGALYIRVSTDKQEELSPDAQKRLLLDYAKKHKILIKDDFKVIDGDPKFNKIWTEPVNARAFASELIKHNYREGWKLPDMPK